MSSIKTYEDLEAEEKRLYALLYSHKANIKDSFSAVKDSLNPVKQAVDTAKKFFSRDKTNPMMRFGVDLGVDVLIRRFLLANAGWFTKVIVPFFVRNYSSHVVNTLKNSKLAQKVVGFFKSDKEDITYPQEVVITPETSSVAN